MSGIATADGIISLALACFGGLLVAFVPEFRAVFCAWLAVMRETWKHAHGPGDQCNSKCAVFYG